MTQRNDEFPSDAAAVTTSDTATNIFCGVYIGGTGDLKVVTAGGTTVTFKALPVGTFLKLGIAKIFATGTTATNIVGLIP